jgi:hypothetical protein
VVEEVGSAAEPQAVTNLPVALAGVEPAIRIDRAVRRHDSLPRAARAQAGRGECRSIDARTEPMTGAPHPTVPLIRNSTPSPVPDPLPRTRPTSIMIRPRPDTRGQHRRPVGGPVKARHWCAVSSHFA